MTDRDPEREKPAPEHHHVFPRREVGKTLILLACPCGRAPIDELAAQDWVVTDEEDSRGTE